MCLKDGARRRHFLKSAKQVRCARADVADTEDATTIAKRDDIVRLNRSKTSRLKTHFVFTRSRSKCKW